VKNASTVVETALVKAGGTVTNTAGITTAVNSSKKDANTVLSITGNSNGYFIIGINVGGDVASGLGYVYASRDGGLKSCHQEGLAPQV
jgi:hypothetical protein